MIASAPVTAAHPPSPAAPVGAYPEHPGPSRAIPVAEHDARARHALPTAPSGVDEPCNEEASRARPILTHADTGVLRLCYAAAIANGSGCVAFHSDEVLPLACAAGIDNAALLASCAALERAGCLLVFPLLGGVFHGVTTGAGFARYARECIPSIDATIASMTRQVEAGIGDNARIAETLGQPAWLIVAIRRAGLRA